MLYALLLIATIVFYEAVVRLKAFDPVRVIFTASPEGFRTISSLALTDDEKEQRLRQLSKQVLRATGEMLLKLALALIATAAVLWLGATMLSVPWPRLERLMLSLPVIGALVIVTIIYARLRRVVL